MSKIRKVNLNIGYLHTVHVSGLICLVFGDLETVISFRLAADKLKTSLKIPLMGLHM